MTEVMGKFSTGRGRQVWHRQQQQQNWTKPSCVHFQWKHNRYTWEVVGFFVCVLFIQQGLYSLKVKVQGF